MKPLGIEEHRTDVSSSGAAPFGDGWRARVGAPRVRMHLRAMARLLGLAAVSLIAGVGAAVARVLDRPAPTAARRLRAASARGWARFVARIVGMRLRVTGAPPTTPSLLVANHLGYVDVVALWSAVDGCFVAKSEVAGWPVVGVLGRVLRTLFIDRTRRRDVLRVLGEMEAALGRDEHVILFAEGTSSDGDRVLPFKSSLFEAAVRTGRPVACAHLAYRTATGSPPASQAVCWWGDMTFPDHLYELLCLPAFEARLCFLPGALGSTDRKWLARAARSAIAARAPAPALGGMP
jgi:1-acyl-sn-glycerol-3-phosphate acyltransferase